MDKDEVNVTDQDSLSAEEIAQLAEMEAGDKSSDNGELPVPPKPAPKKKPAPKASNQPLPAAEGEGAGEGEGDGDADGQGDGNRSRMVPHQALHEAREELKAQRAAMAKEQEAHKAEMARAMERFEKTLAAFAPKPPEVKPEPVPDFDTDPAGWIAFKMKDGDKKLEEVQTELKGLREEKAQRVEQDKNRSVVNEIMGYAVAKENAFKTANPDYDEASAFLRKNRIEDLAEMGYPAEQIPQIIQTEILTVAAQAKQSGKDPAAIVYAMAKRAGYQKKAAAADDDGGAGDGGQKQDGKEKLETVRKGSEASVGLSGARGNAPSPLTAQRLLEMSEADFDKAVNTPEGRALLGL